MHLATRDLVISEQFVAVGPRSKGVKVSPFANYLAELTCARSRAERGFLRMKFPQFVFDNQLSDALDSGYLRSPR